MPSTASSAATSTSICALGVTPFVVRAASLDDLRERDRRALADRLARGRRAVEHEQVGDQRGDPLRVAMDRREELLRRLGIDAAAEQRLGVARDRRDRRAQLVRGVRQELAAHGLERAHPRDVVEHDDRPRIGAGRRLAAARCRAARAGAHRAAEQLELAPRPARRRARCVDERREPARQSLPSPTSGSRGVVDEHDLAVAIDHDHALDEAAEHDRQQVALLGQLADPRLDLAGHVHHRAREHAELAAGLDPVGGGTS